MSEQETGRNIEALQQLRRVIEAAPDDRLHMNTFCRQEGCGTAYCAAGWAAIDPWFRENTAIGEAFRVTADPDGQLLVDVKSSFVHAILATILGISRTNSDDLFAIDGAEINDHAISKAEVLGRIDALIAGEDIEPYAAVLASQDEDEDDDWDDDEDD